VLFFFVALPRLVLKLVILAFVFIIRLRSSSFLQETRKKKKKKKKYSLLPTTGGQVAMDDLSFSFTNQSGANRGSSLFKFASFKHSLSKEKMESSGVIPLEYIVEELEGELAASQGGAEAKPEVPDMLDLRGSAGTGKKKALPKRQTKKKKREEYSDEEDDAGDDDEEVESEGEGGTKRGGGGGKHFVDITEYLCLPQSDAAAKLGLPGVLVVRVDVLVFLTEVFVCAVSTLSKRWKESAKTRKWPFRKVAKLDKEIAAVLTAVPQAGVDAGALPPALEEQLTAMLKERAFDLRKISIRI